MVSPFFTVWYCSAFIWCGAAAASPSLTFTAVPTGTFSVYSPGLGGVVQRRNSGLSFCRSCTGTLAHSATRRRSRAGGSVTVSVAVGMAGTMSKPYCAGFLAMMTAARIMGT